MSRESAYEVGYREGQASAAEDVKTAKADALREAADALAGVSTPNVDDEWWYTGWLRARAAKIEQGEA